VDVVAQGHRTTIAARMRGGESDGESVPCDQDGGCGGSGGSSTSGTSRPRAAGEPTRGAPAAVSAPLSRGGLEAGESRVSTTVGLVLGVDAADGLL
jgi:hypothetical protein